MENVKFIDKRFDPSSTPFLDLAKQMAKAFGYTADLKTEKHLAAGTVPIHGQPLPQAQYRCALECGPRGSTGCVHA